MTKNSPLIKIKIQNEDFDVSVETKMLQQTNTGAIVNFVGIVRGYDEKNDQIIDSMTLEHYPGMTESEIEKIIVESYKKWELTGITVIHRVGDFLEDYVNAGSNIITFHYEINENLNPELNSLRPILKKQKLLSNLPKLKPGEQTILMKEAIIDYFIKKGFIS